MQPSSATSHANHSTGGWRAKPYFQPLCKRKEPYVFEDFHYRQAPHKGGIDHHPKQSYPATLTSTLPTWIRAIHMAAKLEALAKSGWAPPAPPGYMGNWESPLQYDSSTAEHLPLVTIARNTSHWVYRGDSSYGLPPGSKSGDTNTGCYVPVENNTSWPPIKMNIFVFFISWYPP